MEDVLKKIDMKLLMIGMGFLAAHLIVATVFILYNGSARTSHSETLSTQRGNWENDDIVRAREHEELMQEKFGADKLTRIVVDPRLDLEKTILKLFEAVVPPEYTVEVKTDRFTEFHVMVNTYNMPKTDTLADHLKEVFTRLDPKYVFEIVFTDGEKAWIIDRKQLERVNWNSPSDSQIMRYCFPSR